MVGGEPRKLGRNKQPTERMWRAKGEGTWGETKTEEKGIRWWVEMEGDGKGGEGGGGCTETKVNQGSGSKGETKC